MKVKEEGRKPGWGPYSSVNQLFQRKWNVHGKFSGRDFAWILE